MITPLRYIALEGVKASIDENARFHKRYYAPFLRALNMMARNGEISAADVTYLLIEGNYGRLGRIMQRAVEICRGETVETLHPNEEKFAKLLGAELYFDDDFQPADWERVQVSLMQMPSELFGQIEAGLNSLRSFDLRVQNSEG